MARLRAFPKTFWVINGIELLERGAYYSLSAVFTVFMMATFRGEGMGDAAAASLAGSLGALLFLLLYLVPVVSAPFSEKYGYRASLFLVFGLLLAGYVTTFVATGTTLIVLAVVFIGLGAGIFKPIPAALVSQTSTQEQRNFAFSIYYACINIGALVFPGAIGLAALAFGLGTDALFRISFGVAATLTAINLLAAVLVFRNLRAPEKDKNVFQSIKTLGEIFRYPSFVVLMIIYAGFWYMYALSLTFIVAFMGDFQRMPAWFNESLLMTINPLVIIAVAPLIGGITQRFNSLALMIGGIFLYALGLVTLGFSNTSLLFVGGIILFSVGELITHPSYLSYVSKIAPAGKESVFLGYGFIPVGVGLFLGSSIGGTLYGRIALEQGRPELFWSIMASVGLVTAALLIVYNLVIGRKVEGAAPAPAPAGSRRGGFVAMGAAIVVLMLVPALVLAGSVIPARDGGGAGVDALSTGTLATITLGPIEGSVEEGAPSEAVVTLAEGATGEAVFTLTWTDEASPNAVSTNSPDRLKLHVVAPNGTAYASEEVANPQGGEGKITLKLSGIAAGDYLVHVEAVDCGDTTTANPLLPVGRTPDTSAQYALAVEHQAAGA